MKLGPAALHRLYFLSLALKGFDAAIETAGGLALLFVKAESLVRFIRWLTSAELHEDPHDFIANAFQRLATTLAVNDKTFLALYLTAHGLIKALIVIGLLRERPWMYPVGLAGLGGFVVYQLYLFSMNHSPWLLVLAGFDALIMGFVWREWGSKTRRAD